MLSRTLIGLLILWLSLFFTHSFAATKNPLPAEQAFKLSTSMNTANEIQAKWDIAPGYYLYRERIHFSFTPKTPVDIRYPQGEIKTSAIHGKYEVYSGALTIPMKLSTEVQEIQLRIEYQGCSSNGFCYPPMSKNVTLTSPHQTGIAGTVQAPPTNTTSFRSLLTNQNSVQALFHQEDLRVMLFLFVGLGLLLAFTPCVLPMIPILTGIIIGQKQKVSAKKAFFLSLSYVMGSAVTYAVAGLLAAAMGNSLQSWLQKPWIIAAVSGLFVLLSLSLFGLYDLALPNRLQNRIIHLSNKQQGGTYVGTFLMGILSALIVSPCVTAPLVGVLMYIAQTGNLVFGASALFSMGLGMGIPLIIIGTSTGKWLPKSGPWMEAVKKISGLIMLGMAIWLLSRVLPVAIIKMCWGLFLVMTAVFFSIYMPRIIGRHKVNRSLGFAAGFSGMMLMMGGAGIPMPMMNWMHVEQEATNTREFVVVRNLDDLNKQLTSAKAAHQSVILDFYADWCESCVSMDKNVFNTEKIQKELTPYLLLRADITAYTAADETLLKQYQVIAPPTVLFIDSEGKEINPERIVGEVDAKEFLTRLKHLAEKKTT